MPQRPTWALLVSVLLLAVLLTYVLVNGQGEIARWYFAATRNAIEDGRFEDAVDSADKGLFWNSGYTDLILLRANAHFELENYEACLADYDQVMQIAAQDGVDNQMDVTPKAQKAQTLHRIGRYQESLDLMDEIVDFHKEAYRLRDDAESKEEYALSLNNRAYSEAQAFSKGVKVDIEKSLEDVQLALELLGDKEEAFIIDSLGYIQLLNGEHNEALRNLEIAVTETARQNEAFKKGLHAQMQSVADQRPYQRILEQMDQQYSIILHHRGEAHAALGNEEESRADIEEAKRLGFNPEKGIW